MTEPAVRAAAGPTAAPSVPAPSDQAAADQAAADQAAGAREGAALLVIVSVQLMVVLDGTVVNIALPRIQRDLGFSATTLSWVLNAYTLAFGGLLLLGGRAGDIFGRRQVLMGGVALFTLASLAGGLAQDPGMLLAARAVQGIGAACASPSALALIAANFPEGAPRNRALGVYMAVSSGGSGVGLVLGGALTSWVSWRWVFFVNVPVGAAVLLAAPRFIADSERRPARFDLRGALTSTLGMTGLVYGFIRASQAGWRDPGTLGAFAAAVVLLAYFLWTETRVPQPLVPLHLFTERTRAGAYAIRTLLVAGMFGVFFFLTQFIQEVFGYSPLRAGFAFVPMTVVMFVASRQVSALVPRFGARNLTIFGAAAGVVGMLWLSRLGAHSNYWEGIFVPLLIFGCGMGVPMIATTSMSLAGVRREDTGAASGLVNAALQVGGTVGLAVLVTVFSAANGQGTPRQELVHGVQDVFLGAAGFAFAALLVAVFVLRPQPAADVADEADEAVEAVAD